MNDTPGRSGKGALAPADVASCLQPQTSVEFVGDDTDEADAVLSGYQACSAPTCAPVHSWRGCWDEILVNVTPILLGDGVRTFARSGAPVRLEAIAVCDPGQVTELGYGARRRGGPWSGSRTCMCSTHSRTWEPGYAIAELNSGRFFKEPGRRVPVRAVGVGPQPVTTMGGVAITPEVLVCDVSPQNTAVLLLVGADTWGESQHDAVLHKIEELLDAGANVAAICGAIGALANAGVFDDRAHTSNSPQYLEMVAPNYRGQANTTWTPPPWPTPT